MSLVLTELFQKVQHVLDRECASKAEALIFGAETQLVDGAPTREQAGDLLATLSARSANSARTGKRIFGLEQLIAKLAQLDSSAVVVGYGFISPEAAGSVYLAAEPCKPLGAAIVDR